jgi:hypothetical protein
MQIHEMHETQRPSPNAPNPKNALSRWRQSQQSPDIDLRLAVSLNDINYVFGGRLTLL